jgi:hypothetical protein
MKLGYALAISSAFLTGCVHSIAPAGTFVSDRPGFSDGPAIVPVGRLQLETGYTYNHPPGEVYHSLGEILLRAGIANSFEIRAHVNSYAIRVADSESSGGLEDSKISLKYRLRNESTENRLLPALSIIGATSIPTGSADLTTGRAVPEVKIAANWLTGGRVTIVANSGIAWGASDRRSINLAQTAAGWLSISQSVSGFVELYSNSIVRGAGTDSRAIDGGFTLLTSGRSQIDARVGRSIKRDSPDSFFGLGFATRW